MSKILLVTSKPPLPVVDGGTYASYNLMEQLSSQNYQVDLLTLATHKHPFNSEIFDNYSVKHKKINTKLTLVGFVKSFIKREPYNLVRFYDKDFLDLIVTSVKSNNYSTIIFDSLYTAVYTDKLTIPKSIKLIYRSHNVEWKIWKQKYEHERLPVKRKIYQKIYQFLKPVEISLLDNFSVIFTVSLLDKEVLSKHTNTKIINIPISISNGSNDFCLMTFKKLKIYQLASFDWQPNIEGINWFLRNVWSKKSFKENFHLSLVGRGVENLNIKDRKNTSISISENLEDINFIKNQQVCIVPLFVASGSRVKIIEAMSLGKCVVCTSIALGDIPAKHMRDVVIANTAQEFTNSLDFLFSLPEKLNEIAENAFNLSRKVYSMEKIAFSISKYIGAEE